MEISAILSAGTTLKHPVNQLDRRGFNLSGQRRLTASIEAGHYPALSFDS